MFPSLSQHRICEYLGLGCSHTRSFRDLPSAVRVQIYEEAGVVSDSDINLNRLSAEGSWAFTTNFGATYSLLTSCRAIYNELIPSIYSTNRYFIRYGDQRSLQPLRLLTESSLSSLRHLTLHLNVTSCEAGIPCCRAYPGRPKTCDRHDRRPLGNSTLLDQAVIREWRQTAAYIFSKMNLPSLNFHFVCDVSNHKAAQQVLEAFSTVPPLASCAIRLARRPDDALQELARVTALHAIGHRRQAPIGSHFRFLDLPPELRRHILEYTDLVAPLKEIQWSPDRRFHLFYDRWCCSGDENCPPRLHQACQLRNCWEWTGSTGCFCSGVHSAFWKGCQCWKSPSALFLVCRAMLEDVRMVFFLQNRFIVMPEGFVHSVVDAVPSRIHIANFLTEVVPRSAFCSLRDLEIVFPPFIMPHHTPKYLACQDWLRAIDVAKNCLCLPMLTVQVHMVDKLWHDNDKLCQDKISKPHFRSSMSKEQGMEIVAAYILIMKPLEKLKVLNRFFVHVAWPW